MADGTVKQVNPLSGTHVWTVPGRGNRPLTPAKSPGAGSGSSGAGVPCAFCPERFEEVPPEKARVVLTDAGFVTRSGVAPEDLASSVAEFRRIPNLFEIVSFDYWRANHGHAPSPAQRERHEQWMASPVGRRILLGVLRARHLASGNDSAPWEAMSEDERLAGSVAFFAGGHDLVVGRQHLADSSTLASSGTLTPEEHAAYIAFTVESMADLYETIPAARYVATFQNWLAPAGASFDHLHKQLVTIDEHGDQVRRELDRVAADPDLYDRHLAYLRQQDLVVAENEHAVAYAAFGHRYPTLGVTSKESNARPFEMSAEQITGFSDLLHALHAATGPTIPTNEEWHHRPLDVEAPMPWRVNLKWRVSTLAGFEGGTRIYVTTVSPWALRDRVRAALIDLRMDRRISAHLTVAG